MCKQYVRSVLVYSSRVVNWCLLQETSLEVTSLFGIYFVTYCYFLVVAKTLKQSEIRARFEASLKYEAGVLREYRTDMQGEVEICNE